MSGYEPRDYTPEYAEGEILVRFQVKLHAHDDFVKKIVELAGYELKNEKYELSDSYIIKTKPGEEDKACEEFKTLRINGHELVDWAERRDVKLEKRLNDLEELVSMAEILRSDSPELGNTEYNKRLDALIAYADNLKEKK